MHFVTITIPGEPVAKERARITVVAGRARAYTPKKTVHFESHVQWLAVEAMGGHKPLTGALGVRVRLYRSIPASWSKKKKDRALAGILLPESRPDIDNYLKSVLDAMNAIVYVDDALICDLSVTKRYSSEPRLTVDVYQLNRPVG